MRMSYFIRLRLSANISQWGHVTPSFIDKRSGVIIQIMLRVISEGRIRLVTKSVSWSFECIFPDIPWVDRSIYVSTWKRPRSLIGHIASLSHWFCSFFSPFPSFSPFSLSLSYISSSSLSFFCPFYLSSLYLLKDVLVYQIRLLEGGSWSLLEPLRSKIRTDPNQAIKDKEWKNRKQSRLNKNINSEYFLCARVGEQRIAISTSKQEVWRILQDFKDFSSLIQIFLSSWKKWRRR